MTRIGWQNGSGYPAEQRHPCARTKGHDSIYASLEGDAYASSACMNPSSDDASLYIALISVHGLIRGHDLELGRDADTGGQVKYVIEMAGALARHPDVDRVDLFTRQVVDAKVSPDYAQPLEELAPGAFIVRLPCGPRRYFRKEVLWPYLDGFVDQALHHMRKVGRVPDLVHGHYADAGYVGSRLAGLLGVPFVFTGHSLGRVKRQYLLEKGVKEEKLESYFRLSERIEAEEEALDAAARVIVGTNHEVEEQYVLYDHYRPERKLIIPPGTNLGRFRPPRREDPRPPMWNELARFLRDVRRPMILALSRPDERKNLATLVQAYAEHPDLREQANLVLIVGNREDLRTMDRGQSRVLKDLLLQIDYYDLYGSVAFPKQHESEDVPDLYRLAARSRGVFVLPTVSELFGLTLIEAAASGLPVVATQNGGPEDIVGYCENGLLVDPLDAGAMGAAIRDALADTERWKTWSKNGVRRARRRYTWKNHVDAYVKAMRKVLHLRQRPAIRVKSRLPKVDRIVISDIDNTLVGEAAALRELLARLKEASSFVGFGVATGRTRESTLEVLRAWEIPVPDVLITSVGSEIYYSPRDLTEDRGWRKHIAYRWQPEALREALAVLPGLDLQPAAAQRRHRICYFVEAAQAPSLRDIKSHLRQRNLSANLVYSHQQFLDVLPIRASKGRALRYLVMRWGVSMERVLVAGDSGNDEEMLKGDTLGVVVGNHSPELDKLRDNPRIYFAETHHARGILEGMSYYDFLGEVRIPDLDEHLVAV